MGDNFFYLNKTQKQIKLVKLRALYNNKWYYVSNSKLVSVLTKELG